MKPAIIFATLFLFSRVSPAQSILNDYFNGDKDSLVAEANKLINMPEPDFSLAPPVQAGPQAMADMGFEQVYETENHWFTVRDNKKIFAYRFPSKSPNTVILLHGTASSAYLYNKTAGLLQQATQAEVFAVDFRGHGQSEGQPGDVDYMDQYADDLTDIIKILRREKPNGKIVLAAHSMGGGVALRQGMGKHLDKADGLVLFSPLIGHDSPAFPQAPPSENGGAANSGAASSFMKIHIPRLIGLKMLNEINMHSHDHLPVLFFNLPESVPLRQYAYRANMGMAPESFKAGLAAVRIPMLVLIGSQDEAFVPEVLKNAVLDNSQADVLMVEGATHNGIRHHPKAFEAVGTWFTGL